jgi:5-methylcytosine-specific restriction endonuclease McrA
MRRLRQKQPRLKLSRAEYYALRCRVLERDGWRCQHCSASKDLQIHHLRPRSRLGNDELSNLISLCANCHGLHHGKPVRRPDYVAPKESRF